MRRPKDQISGQGYGIAAFIATLGLVALSGLGPRIAATERLLPHGYCFSWDPPLMRLHIVSDALIGLAYIAIPLSLVSFMRQRTDLPFNWMFVLFGLFIVACGATHLIELWTFWYPHYWLQGSVKAITAAASIPTAILLYRLVPHAVALPSNRQLVEAKSALEEEIVRREQAQAELRRAHVLLEEKVQERTAKLRAANARLQAQSESLKRVDRQKDNFLAILSHELRNPVHAIRMGANCLGAVSSDEAVKATSASIDRHVVHITQILNNLLGVLKEKQEDATLDKRPTDLRTVAKHSVDETAAFFEQRGQVLEFRLPAHPVMVDIDSGQMRQAITNLLTNASHYSDRETTVKLEVVISEDRACLVVKDMGIGFDTEESQRMFELFARGERAKRHSVDGLGIGLYLTKRIVEAHGGRLRGYSEGAGLGSEFSISLPLMLPGSAAPQP